MATLACGPAEETLEVAPHDASQASTSPAVLSQPADDDIAYRDGRVRLRVEGASNLVVLARLGDLAGFSVFAEGVEARPLNLWLDDAGLGEAVPLLLPGERLSLDYAWDEKQARQQLVRVYVGGSMETLAARFDTLGRSDPKKTFGEAYARKSVKQVRKEAEKAADLAERQARLSPEGQALERARREKVRLAMEAREAEEAHARAALAAQLGSENSEERIAAVADFEADDGGGFDPLLDLLAADTNQKVRVAVLERLQGESEFAVTRAFVEALDDPDPGVVRAALEGLRSTGDASVARDLDHLLDHENADVRAAAAETIEYLE